MTCARTAVINVSVNSAHFIFTIFGQSTNSKTELLNVYEKNYPGLCTLQCNVHVSVFKSYIITDRNAGAEKTKKQYTVAPTRARMKAEATKLKFDELPYTCVFLNCKLLFKHFFKQ